jgi:RNA polymerase sigma factor (sigma-70 family)
MKEQRLNQTVDSILIPFLQARDEAESQRLLGHLIAEHILPVSKEIIYHKLRTHTAGQNQQDSEDVQNNVVLKLLSTLRECKHNPDFKSINNFRSYVAVTAYNACNEYLRQRYPQRHSLKNQLRYLFTHFPQLAMWNNEDGKPVCGTIEMKDQKRVSTSQGEIISLVNRVRSLELNNQPLIDTVFTILKLLPASVELDDLVSLVAEAKGIKDEAAQSEGEDGESLLERMADARPRIDSSVEQRFYLERLWKEICELPLRQRVALLLNLKDEYGNSQVEMLPFTGVATMRQIASVLEMSDEEFAQLWNELPMEDAQIAERLNLTRQQIINLRKSARQRLAKKMRESAF